MAKRKSTIATFATGSTRYTANAAEKAITGLARWASTDHTGTAKVPANLPPFAWMYKLGIVLVTCLCGVLGAVASGALFVLLVASDISFLLG